MTNLSDRKKIILDSEELWLGIEGKYTNLRIWKGRIHPKNNSDDTEAIYMRLDKANAYSAPLYKESLQYIENKKSCVYQLAKFECPTALETLDEILEITKGLSIRKNIVVW